jgi:ribosomal protein S18 acetylase RimI-like enzyme
MMLDFYAHEGISSELSSAKIALETLLQGSEFGKVWLFGFQDDELAGYLVLTYSFSLEYGGVNALIDELYVRPEWRRQGIGDEALRFLEQILRNEGVNTLYLEVDRDNAVAQLLYRKHRFGDKNRFLLSKRLNRAP